LKIKTFMSIWCKKLTNFRANLILEESVRPIKEAFFKGFRSFMMVDELKIFEDPDELNLILSGPQFIDLEDWRKNTVY